MSAYLSAGAAEGQAEAALSKAQADSDRASDLFEHNAVAKKDVQTAQSALAQAKAALEQARATREQSRRRLTVLGLSPNGFDQQVVLRAPLSGKVLELSVVPGEFRNDTTAPLMTLADLSTVWVTSQVPETYIRFVQVGERVQISLVAFPGETFEGRVSRIADTVGCTDANREGTGRARQLARKVPARDVRERPPHRIDQTDAGCAGGRRHSERRARDGVRRDADGPIRAPAGDDWCAGGRCRRGCVSGLSEGDTVVVDGAMLLQGLLRRS